MWCGRAATSAGASPTGCTVATAGMAGMFGSWRNHAGGGAITMTGAACSTSVDTSTLAWATGAGVLMLSVAHPARVAASEAVVTRAFTPGAPFGRTMLRSVVI